MGGGITRKQFGWSVLEFARAPSGTLIIMFIFAPYFTQYVVGDTVRGIEYWGLANTLGGFAIACLAPIIGAIVDRMGRRKPWLVLIIALMAVLECSLWFALPNASGPLSLGAIVLLIAVFAFLFETTALLHNAMLDSVGSADEIGRASGLGYAMANAATILAILIILALVMLPAQGLNPFGLLPDVPILGLNAATHEHNRIVGPYVALWLVLFTIPFAFLASDRPATGVPLRRVVRQGLAQLVDTLRQARRIGNVARFLVARTIYNDAIVALQAYSAIYGAGVFGWTGADILVFGILLAATCALGGLVAAHADSRFGSRAMILAGNIGITVNLLVMTSCSENHVLLMRWTGADPFRHLPIFSNVPEMAFTLSFLCLGFSATAVLVSSRALLAKIAPVSMMTQFFGIYSLSGYATAFVGHAMVSSITGVTKSQRLGMLSMIVLIAVGQWVMFRVKEQRSTLGA